MKERASIENANKCSTEYKPTLNQLIMFQVQKVLAVKILEKDKEYWIVKIKVQYTELVINLNPRN